MKRIFSPFLGVLMLVFTSCNNDKGDDIEYIANIPAIVGYNYSLNQPVLITPGEIFLAPDLDYDFYYLLLYEGDAVMAYISLNHTRQPSKDYRTVSVLDYTYFDKASPFVEGESDATNFVPVEDMRLYAMIMHDRIQVLFAGFSHTSYYRDFDYEMTYDPDETGKTLTLSVRATGKGREYQTKESFWWVGVFDMYEYLMTLEKDSENKVKLNFRYNTGEDVDGNELWEDCADNPLTITLQEDI